MDWILDRLDALRSGALVFVVFAAVGMILATALDLAARRWVSDDVRTRAAGTAGSVLGVLAIVYGIVAGFVILDEFDQIQSTQQNVADQGAALSAISENAAALPREPRREIRGAAVAYARAAVDVELPRLADTGTPSTDVDRALESLFLAVRAVEPRTPSEEAFYGGIVSALDEVVSTRSRITGASHSAIPGALLAVLLLTGVAMIVLTALLNTRHRQSHLFLVGTLGLVTALSLALIVSLDQPFDGLLGVSDQPLRDFVEFRAER